MIKYKIATGSNEKPFPLVVSGFRKVVSIAKSRNSFDIATKGNFQLSKWDPDIMELAEKHQA